MKTIIVTKHLGDAIVPWYYMYIIPWWGNPAGEVYDLKNGRFLALANTHSHGYTRKVFKTAKMASNWVEKRLRSEFPADEIKIEVEI